MFLKLILLVRFHLINEAPRTFESRVWLARAARLPLPLAAAVLGPRGPGAAGRRLCGPGCDHRQPCHWCLCPHPAARPSQAESAPTTPGRWSPALPDGRILPAACARPSCCWVGVTCRRGPGRNPRQEPRLPEKAEKEKVVSGGPSLVKATTLNLGREAGPSAGEGRRGGQSATRPQATSDRRAHRDSPSPL